MFELANLLVSAGMAAGKALGITLYVLAEASLPQQLGQVASIQMTTAAPVAFCIRPKTAEEQCVYQGVIVPYEQLWEERTTNVLGIETVTPPQPGKIAAYAIVVNRKDCEGRQPEAMFRVNTHLALFHKETVFEGVQFAVVDYANLPEAERPKWIPQVLQTLNAAAATQPAAQKFVQFSAERANAANPQALAQ